MPNPYAGRPAYTFWDRAVANLSPDEVDPVSDAPFRIKRQDAIATAGSCFAQHVSRSLQDKGFNYQVTEQFTPHPGIRNEGYAIFPARFGNIYTPRQLLQLFMRAYGSFRPKTDYMLGRGGNFIDPFRPRIQTGGFVDVDALLQDRERHFCSVRRMFEECKVFIFTLGLTEAWVSVEDGSVYPLAPGVVADQGSEPECRFHNFNVSEIVEDMLQFLDLLKGVNSSANIILTVSPIPLIATYEDRHVLVSTIASKSILRAAVEEVCQRRSMVSYFPAFEMITGPHTRGRFYASDLREIHPEGVAYVMSKFAMHYLDDDQSATKSQDDRRLSLEDQERFRQLADIVCDEIEITRGA